MGARVGESVRVHVWFRVCVSVCVGASVCVNVWVRV